MSINTIWKIQVRFKLFLKYQPRCTLRTMDIILLSCQVKDIECQNQHFMMTSKDVHKSN